MDPFDQKCRTDEKRSFVRSEKLRNRFNRESCGRHLPFIEKFTLTRIRSDPRQKVISQANFVANSDSQHKVEHFVFDSVLDQFSIKKFEQPLILIENCKQT